MPTTSQKHGGTFMNTMRTIRNWLSSHGQALRSLT
jgi:hypothetical protein